MNYCKFEKQSKDIKYKNTMHDKYSEYFTEDLLKYFQTK